MTLRPVLFNGAMVRAILSGTKTQTRRPCPIDLEFLGGKGEQDNPDCWGHAFDGKQGHGYTVLGRGHEWRHHHDLHSMPHPHGEPGDELWVRETWAAPPGVTEQRECVYRADLSPEQEREERSVRRSAGGGHATWTPSIHMYRWASRITLGVIETAVARVQDITDEQAKAEGVARFSDAFGCFSIDQPLTSGESARDAEYRASFAVLWDEIYGSKRELLWKSNPWVWVTKFELKAVKL